MKKQLAMVPAVAGLLLVPSVAFAQEVVITEGTAFVGIGLLMGLAVLGGGLGQGNGIRAALEGIARNPQASGRITVPMFAGLAFIESLVILAFIVAFLLQGKIG